LVGQFAHRCRNLLWPGVLLTCLWGASPAAAASDCRRIPETSPLKAAECHAARGEWKEAEEYYRRARQAAPEDLEAALGQARALIHIGQPYDAAMELESILQTRSDSVPALKLLAYLLDQLFMERGLALEMMERCVQLAPDDLEARVFLADLQQLAGMFEQAAGSYQAAIAISPRNPSLHARLAQCRAGAGKHEEAESGFRAALEMNKSVLRPDPSVHTRYGEHLLERARFAESAAQFTAALKLDPRSSAALLARARAYEKLGELEKAEADALAAVRESGPGIEACELLRRVYGALNQPDKAREQSGMILQILTEREARQSLLRNLRAATSKGRALMEEGRFREAAARFEEAARLAPGYPETFFHAAVCHVQDLQPAKAEPWLRRYVEARPYLATGRAVLGIILLELGVLSESRAELERALELDPELSEAREALAHLAALEPGALTLPELGKETRSAFQAGDYREVSRMLESSPLSEASWDPELFEFLAAARLQQGLAESAIHALDRGLQRHPQSEALARLCLGALDSLRVDQSPRREAWMERLAQTSPAFARVLRNSPSPADPTGQPR
jgi:tetratricopeptide (TPR) repeat protein